MIIFVLLGFFGATYLTVVNLPDVFAANDTIQTWTFNTANSSQFTKDDALVAIDTNAHPVTGVNKLTNPAFTSDVSSWSTAAVPPSGWVEVPGNSGTYGTENFLVMQYEAKYDCTGDDDGDTAAACSAPADSGAGVDYRDISGFNKDNVVSTANGAPIVHITQQQAINACPTGYHLITSNEWMTISQNVAAQSSNWADGTVGSTVASGGGLKRGNVGNDDSVGYNGADPEQGTGRNEKAKLTLSNGAAIWDLSGNVWEWNNNTILEQNKPDSGITNNWAEWTTISDYGTLTYNDVRPIDHTDWNSSYGIGQYYMGPRTSWTTYAFRRGGIWNDTSDAGVFALRLNAGPTYQHYAVGFRCASDPVAISGIFSSSLGRGAAGGAIFAVGSVSDGKLYQSVNVGDTSTYNFSVYVYDNTAGSEGGTVDATVASLYYNGAAISTNYSNVGSGWWKLSGTLTGANESREYGVLVKTGKTVVVDDFTLSKDGTYQVYTTTAYPNAQVVTWDSFSADSAASGNASVVYQLCTDDGSTCESGGSWKYWDGDSWETASNTTTHVNTEAQLTESVMQALSVVNQKISVKAIFTFGGADTPTLSSVSIGLTTDTTAPTTNASNIGMSKTNGGVDIASNGWTNNVAPYFSWTAGADNPGGSGLKGYCLYLGTDPDGNPATSKGLLGTSPVSTTGTTCQFIVASTSIDFVTSSLRGDPWLTSSSNPYYLNIKAVDNGGQVYTGSSASFQFRFDSTTPTNVSYLSCASGSFANVADMNFSWPTSGGVASSDSNSGILGWQYQINSTAGTWLGTTTDADLGIDYIPTGDTSRTLTQDQDGASIVTGNNIVYFRSVDVSGNTSSDATIRTCNLAYGGAAPSFGQTDTVTVTPSTATSNSFALSWPAAEATVGQTVTNYYYMINVAPPSTLATLEGNATTYIDNGTTRTVSATALPSVNKGSNTVYVIAVDDADNYSPSNYITGTFTLNSTDPDNVGNLVASDSSIKSQSQWNVTLTWTAPSYKGAGNLTYLIYRSTDGTNFSQVGSTSGLSYVDTTPSSAKYYYKVYSKDGANAQSSGTNAVSITPTGKWTSAPSLNSGPDVSSITTRKATITWSTSRSADSKIQYGTSSDDYGDVEPSNSSQVTSHSIQLFGLTPGTKYYYKAKWTDEDGNTGTSEEKSFTTDPAPSVKDVSAKNIGLTSGIIQFTSTGASKVKIYYGTSTSFGGAKEISTSTSETTYTAELTGLSDGTKYYYKINTFDSDGTEYEGTVLDFTTYPRPRISNVRIQEVRGTAQPTVLVTWLSNTEISSIVTYYPQGEPEKARDEVNIELTKGEHKLLVKGLLPETDYILIVKGRDAIGNEGTSDSQRFTTSTDTRPPQISNLKIEGTTVPPVSGAGQESTAQLIVSWDTDEPATSQIEYGEGTGSVYSRKTQDDTNLTTNHLVIISGLTPSKVYHLRALSKDKAGNEGKSVDTVTIAPKSTESALDLVVGNLSDIFGFLKNIQ